MRRPSIPIYDMKCCVFLMFEPNDQAWIMTNNGDWLKVRVEAEEVSPHMEEDESGWLIEFPMVDGHHLYYGRTVEGLSLTPEPSDAIRFSRKQDAEEIIADKAWDEARAIKHVWT